MIVHLPGRSSERWEDQWLGLLGEPPATGKGEAGEKWRAADVRSGYSGVVGEEKSFVFLHGVL